MHINQMRESNFLKKEDVGQGALMTISEVFQENVAKEGAPPEMKWCIAFNESEKPMVLNSTNAQIIASILGSHETDDWTGKKIVLFHDPSVSFGGKIVGGIRCRAPRGAAAHVNANAPAAGAKPSPFGQRHNTPAQPAHPPAQATQAANNGAASVEDDVPF